jgi:hypothetical protein
MMSVYCLKYFMDLRAEYGIRRHLQAPAGEEIRRYSARLRALPFGFLSQ